jgi:tellurium resistance protein TerD
MAINLTKGGRINLSKEAPMMKRIRVGLCWDVNATDTGADFDLDVTAFVLKKGATDTDKPKCLGENYMIFYNQLRSPDDGVVHTGDNRKGDSDGDDEAIIVDTSKLTTNADEISFIVTIHEAGPRGQNFGQVRNAKIKLYNDETNELVTQYDLEEDFSIETAVQFGSLYKKDGTWNFKAVGAGYKLGLDAFCTGYGLQVA